MDDFINGKNFSELNQYGLEYFKTDDYWNILAYIVKVRKDPLNIYKLITHNSDWSVSKCLESMGLLIEKLPKNLKWYAQNVDIEHPQIFSIPIGLENPEWHKKQQKTNKISYINKYAPKTSEFISLAYFNIATNPRRKAIYDYLSQFDWCTTKITENGTGFDEYLDLINRSIFCICPEGNGIDTHRIWEALYLGCIPVVEDCVNIRFYKDLPIYICDSFFTLTRDKLIDKHMEIIANMPNYNNSMLKMEYWREKIYDTL